MSSQPSEPSGAGKASRDKKRRTSDPLPYKRPSKTATMPTTRRSPARREESPAALPQPADVLRELALLRQSIDTQFADSAKKVDNLKGEIISKLDANDKAVSELQVSVADVTLSVDQNSRAIHEVRAEVERREIELPARVRDIVNEALGVARAANLPGVRPRALGTTSSVAATPSTSAPKDKDAAYTLARRSFRLWPVSREGSLRERTVEFLVNELRLDQQYAADLLFDVKRVGRQRSKDSTTPVKDEVLVTFETVRERDDVRSYARNFERKGRGLRLEIPEHLWPSFRVLQDLAYELKLKHPAMKRNILFDDSVSDLKMDFCIGNEWKTILPEEARKSLAKSRPARSLSQRPRATERELEQLLEDGSTGANISMEDQEF